MELLQLQNVLRREVDRTAYDVLHKRVVKDVVRKVERILLFIDHPSINIRQITGTVLAVECRKESNDYYSN